MSPLILHKDINILWCPLVFPYSIILSSSRLLILRFYGHAFVFSFLCSQLIFKATTNFKKIFYHLFFTYFFHHPLYWLLCNVIKKCFMHGSLCDKYSETVYVLEYFYHASHLNESLAGYEILYLHPCMWLKTLISRLFLFLCKGSSFFLSGNFCFCFLVFFVFWFLQFYLIFDKVKFYILEF